MTGGTLAGRTTYHDDLAERVARFCEATIQEQVFPGCVVGVVDLAVDAKVWPLGHLTYMPEAAAVTHDTLYDVASVAKSIPTSSVILRLVDQGVLSLDDRAARYLPELQNAYREEILIRHLLTFTVVFDLGRPMAEIARDESADLLDQILRAPVRNRPGTSYLYTNAPPLLLGLIAERVTSRRLDELANEWFFEPLGMRNTTFYPRELVKRHPNLQVAPTALDWRGEVRGIVHDPGAWWMLEHGHVPGHAGLFSTASDLLRFVQLLLSAGEWDGRRYFSPEMVEAMHTSQTPLLKEEAGLGWEISRSEAHGTKVSSQAFGKTGFTGASVLVDPQKRRGMVLLANRTYPEPGDRADILRVWRELADIVFGDD